MACARADRSASLTVLVALLALLWSGGCGRQKAPIGFTEDAVHPGQDVAVAERLLARLGSGEPLLAMEVWDPDKDLKMWPLGGGVLIARYVKSSGRITSLHWWLADERPKGERQVFEFAVASYTPSSGKMVLSLPSQKRTAGHPQEMVGWTGSKCASRL